MKESTSSQNFTYEEERSVKVHSLTILSSTLQKAIYSVKDAIKYEKSWLI